MLTENWHFLRGDMKGWGFKCKLSNDVDVDDGLRKENYQLRRQLVLGVIVNTTSGTNQKSSAGATDDTRNTTTTTTTAIDNNKT